MIDPVWCAELAGFFWGEGNFKITLLNRHIKSKRTWKDGTIHDYVSPEVFTVSVVVRITQRADSHAVLECIKSKLGGSIYIHRGREMISGANGKVYTNNQQLVWSVSSTETILQILDILDRSQFPTLKRREIAVIRETIQIMHARKYGYSEQDKSRLYELKAELSNLRKFAT